MTITERVKQLRAHRRQQGLCINCGKAPAVSGGQCAFHAEVRRRQCRLWMRRVRGHVPWAVYTNRIARRYATASNAEAWEYRAGHGMMRVWVDWRDPLLVLMAREAKGWFSFMGPSPLVTPRPRYA